MNKIRIISDHIVIIYLPAFGGHFKRKFEFRSLFRTFVIMKILSVTEARKNIYKLINQASDSHEPIHITGKNNNAVLIGEDDWRAIQETIYLLSVPGMRDSIVEGMKTPLSKTASKLKW